MTISMDDKVRKNKTAKCHVILPFYDFVAHRPTVADNTHAKMASRRTEIYQIEPRTYYYVSLMFEFNDECKIIKKTVVVKEIRSWLQPLRPSSPGAGG